MSLVKFNLKLDELQKAINEIKTISWNDIRGIGAEDAKQALKEDIVATIKRGNSPVKAQKRYVKYSESYTAAINRGAYTVFNKKLRPINLTLSGKMLRAIKGRVTDKGIAIWFASPIAKYHDDLGAGKAKTVRRMLPKEGEDFKAAVKERAAEIIGKAFEKALNTKIRSV